MQTALVERREAIATYRAVWPDGSVHWLESRGRGQYAADGTPERMIGTSMDVTERKQAEEELARLATIVTSSDDAIFACGLDNIITTWNRGAERLYGFTGAEIVGQSAARLVPPDGTEEHARLLESIASGSRVEHVEAARLRKDGTPIDVSISMSPIHDSQGRHTGSATIERDISEQRRAHDALREREGQLAEAQQLAHLGSWELDLATERLRWSDEHFRILGLEPSVNGVAYEDGLDYIHPDDKAAARKLINDAIAGRSSYSTELRVVRADETVGWIHSRGAYMPDPLGGPGRMVGTAQDITERKHAEAVLQASEGRNRLALEAAGMGTWDWDLVHDVSTWSVETERLHGLAPGAFAGSFAAFQRVVHPDDWPAFAIEIQAAIVERRDSWWIYRAVWADGSVRWLENKGRPLFASDGTLLRVNGISVDITERKHAEEALLVSEERHRPALEAARMGTW